VSGALIAAQSEALKSFPIPDRQIVDFGAPAAHPVGFWLRETFIPEGVAATFDLTGKNSRKPTKASWVNEVIKF
jgi:hypothetical protein